MDILRTKHSTAITPHGLYLWSTVLLFVVGTANTIFFTHDMVRGMGFIFTTLKTGDESALVVYVTNDQVAVVEQ